jgi:HAMP domain-containing protein
VKIRTRIFAVVFLVILAAFLQALIVLQVEDRRASSAYALDRAIWRLEAQQDLGRIIIDLDAADRGSPAPQGSTGTPSPQGSSVATAPGSPSPQGSSVATAPGSPSPQGPTGASAPGGERLWPLYETGAARLAEVLDTPGSKRQFAAIDAIMREWRAAAPGPARAPLMARARGEYDRFEAIERSRLRDERLRVSSQSLQSMLLTLAVPAVAIIMLLGLVAFVARILLDPLKAISASARRISEGTFDVSLPAESKDEIGDLSRAFREMITAVQRRQQEVTEARVRTEREHRRLQATIETVPVALVIVDADTGRIALQNRTAAALIGHEPDEAAAQ